jgi:hypothetical protein
MSPRHLAPADPGRVAVISGLPATIACPVSPADFQRLPRPQRATCHGSATWSITSVTRSLVRVRRPSVSGRSFPATMVDATFIFFSRPDELISGVFHRIYEKFNHPHEWTLDYRNLIGPPRGSPLTARQPPGTRARHRSGVESQRRGGSHRGYAGHRRPRLRGRDRAPGLAANRRRGQRLRHPPTGRPGAVILAWSLVNSPSWLCLSHSRALTARLRGRRTKDQGPRTKDEGNELSADRRRSIIKISNRRGGSPEKG